VNTSKAHREGPGSDRLRRSAWPRTATTPSWNLRQSPLRACLPGGRGRPMRSSSGSRFPQGPSSKVSSQRSTVSHVAPVPPRSRHRIGSVASSTLPPGRPSASRTTTSRTEHFLLALADDAETGAAGPDRCVGWGVTRDRVYSGLQAVRGGQRVPEPDAGDDPTSRSRRYGRDLTALARQGKLDPVIGRDEEVRRTMQVLSRRNQEQPGP